MKFTIELDNYSRPALFANGVRLPGSQTILTVEFKQSHNDTNKFEWVTDGTST